MKQIIRTNKNIDPIKILIFEGEINHVYPIRNKDKRDIKWHIEQSPAVEAATINGLVIRTLLQLVKQ